MCRPSAEVGIASSTHSHSPYPSSQQALTLSLGLPIRLSLLLQNSHHSSIRPKSTYRSGQPPLRTPPLERKPLWLEKGFRKSLFFSLHPFPSFPFPATSPLASVVFLSPSFPPASSAPTKRASIDMLVSQPDRQSGTLTDDSLFPLFSASFAPTLAFPRSSHHPPSLDIPPPHQTQHPDLPLSSSLRRITPRFGSISGSFILNAFQASSSSASTITTYASYDTDSLQQSQGPSPRRKSSSNKMTQIFHRKTPSQPRANSVDHAGTGSSSSFPSSSQGATDDHRSPSSHQNKRASISSVKGGLKSLFNSSNSSANVAPTPASNLPPSNFRPNHPHSLSEVPSSSDVLTVGAYSVPEGTLASPNDPAWVPPVLQPGAYVSRSDSAQGPMGERLGSADGPSRPGESR